MMKARSVVQSIVIVASVHPCLTASESQPHYHQGKLTKYEVGPPSVLLSARDESRLRAGRAVMQAVVADDGHSHRLIMVQDVPVPSNIAMGRIMDLNKYDQMVSGVDGNVVYASASSAAGLQTVKSEYRISACHLRLKYFVEHTYDPNARCMTFHLDYSRRSDLDDTVGYWYVLPTGRTSCRVYYSCECKLRGWVPAPVYNLLTKEALKKATTWVSTESIKEWRDSRAANEAVLHFVTNIRDSLNSVRLPPPPSFASKWVAERRQAVVRFVSSARSLAPPRDPQLLSASSM